MEGENGLKLEDSEKWSEKVIKFSTLKELQDRHKALTDRYAEENKEGQTEGGKAKATNSDGSEKVVSSYIG